jgi:hypothetical protein
VPIDIFEKVIAEIAELASCQNLFLRFQLPSQQFVVFGAGQQAVFITIGAGPVSISEWAFLNDDVVSVTYGTGDLSCGPAIDVIVFG